MTTKVKCGSHIVNEIFQKHLSSKKLTTEKVIPPSYITKKDIPNNPYISSITGQYAFDLSKISKFNIYFWTSTDDTNQNLAINEVLGIQTALDWSAYYKTQTVKAFNQYTSFADTTSSVVNTYGDSDVVCVLANFPAFLGACYGPYFLYNDPFYVDGRVILFLSSAYTSDVNITEGGEQFTTLVHEFGHGFGLAHPHDNGFESTIMPGSSDVRCDEYGNCTADPYRYPAIAGNIQNNSFNTIMTYNDLSFFFPEQEDFNTTDLGYPETLMPLDASALRWLYNLKGISKAYSLKYGAKVINPPVGTQKTQMIAGDNQEITFGSNCYDVSFYFSNQSITFNNLNPIKYDYNRILEKQWTFYPKDLCSTVSVLNFDNIYVSNIFMEKNSLKTNLVVNCNGNGILNIYIADCEKNYRICGTTYKNKNTGKTMTINNNTSAYINVYFNK